MKAYFLNADGKSLQPGEIWKQPALGATLELIRDRGKDGFYGIIDTQNDVGGWPVLNSSPAPLDTDHDGMPDSWEQKNKLNKENPDDRNTLAPDGYTMLEKYLNSII